MDNNYYINIECEYKENRKGHLGTFSYHDSIHHKYLKMEDIDTLVKEIKRDVNLDRYMITLSIDNLEWFGSGIGIGRIYNDFGKIKYVSWNENNSNCHDCTENRYVDKKEIKSIIYSIVDRFNSYVNAKLTE